MNHRVPPDWKAVLKSDFDEYLKSCPDFRTDGWANGIEYYFTRPRHTPFAFDLEDGFVLVDPELLEPSL